VVNSIVQYIIKKEGRDKMDDFDKILDWERAINPLLEKINLQLSDMEWVCKKNRRWKARFLHVNRGEDAWYKKFVAVHPKIPILVTVGLVYSSKKEDLFDADFNTHCFFVELKGVADQKNIFEWYAYGENNEPEHDLIQDIFQKLCQWEKDMRYKREVMEQQKIEELVKIM
jgi:hypothetical protein